jgi:hypothetical protein
VVEVNKKNEGSDKESSDEHSQEDDDIEKYNPGELIGDISDDGDNHDEMCLQLLLIRKIPTALHAGCHQLNFLCFSEYNLCVYHCVFYKQINKQTYRSSADGILHVML